MLRFVSKLARQFRTANTARTPRRAPRRAVLQLEGLENRLVLSTASLTGSTLHVIVAQPSQQVTFTGDYHPGEVDEFGMRKAGGNPHTTGTEFLRFIFDTVL